MLIKNMGKTGAAALVLPSQKFKKGKYIYGSK